MIPAFFKEYFTNYRGKKMLKPEFYFAVYDRYLAHLRNHRATMLEIGIFYGGSLDMWHAYLGEGATVIGVDIDPSTKEFEKENTPVFIGDQGDPKFLNMLIEKTPILDAVVDDGSHYFHHQIISFLYLFKHLKDNGVYIVEDVHTSYYPEYGGGYGVINTFQKFAFQMTHLINMINIHSSRGCRSTTQMTANLIRVFGLTAEDGEYLFRNLYSVHFYDSMIVFEKRENCRSLENNLVEKQWILGE